MRVIDNDKTIEVLLSDNDILKIRSGDEKEGLIIIQCKQNKLIVNKSNEDDNIAMFISLSNQLER